MLHAAICIVAFAAAWPVDPAVPPPAPAGVGARPVDATPIPVRGIVEMRAFTLAEPFEFDWRLERPMVSAGWILVLEVDPEVVVPRQLAEPVLYAGRQTAERLNGGAGSGRLVVLVPAEPERLADGSASPRRPFGDAPIFFGSAALPEQVDAATIEREVAAAAAAGIRPPTVEAMAAAGARGGAPLAVADRAALLVEAATLVRRHAPDEVERADQLEGLPAAEPSQP